MYQFKNFFINSVSLVLIFLGLITEISAQRATTFSYKPAFGGYTIEGVSVAKVTGTDKGVSGVHFTNPYNPSQTLNVWAGTFNGSVDNNSAKFFCIDLEHTIAYWTVSNPHTYTDSNYTPSQITYILNNYYPAVSYPYSGALGTEGNEAAAVQLAIWHFSDGVNLNTVTNSTLKTRALAIVADANANHNNFVPLAGLVFTPASQTNPVGTPAQFTVRAVDSNGNGIPNLTISFNTTSGTLSATSAVTNSSGYTGLITLTQGVSGTATVTASATTTIPQGTRYVHTVNPGNYQKLVLATPTVATGSNTFNCEWFSYASIGNKVWNDADQDGIQDEGEPGMANVTVFLYNCSDVVIDTTLTDANGNYSFSGLTPGSYYVKFVAPSGYSFTVKDAGSNDSLDSDVDVLTGKTNCTTLSSGENDLSWDAGLVLSTTDYSVSKTVSDTVFTCGESLTYTITVNNSGTLPSTNVVVSDVLPAGLDFVSASATQGVYDTATGKWTVGTLNAGESETLTINVTINCTELNIANIDLGPAKEFNVFVINDINQPSADTQGKMAVGGNAYLSGYSVADMLPASNGTVDVLIVGGDLFFTSGAVYAGNAVYGDSSNLPSYAVTFHSGSVRKDTVIDFAAAKSYLENLSIALGAYSVNGTTTFQWGTVKMTGSNPFLNVFTVNGVDLNNAHTTEINVPNGSAVVVNILGTSISWHGGLFVNGTSRNNVLYNFPQTTSLLIQGIDVTGSILAPFADLNYPAGVVHGQVICKSMTGCGQFNLSPFLGNIPANVSIINVASLFSADVPDSNPLNNSSTAVSAFSADTSSSGGGSGSGGSGNWVLTGNLPAYEVVTTIAANNSNIYVGTVNGYIFKSTDDGASWQRINNDMYSGPVWTIKIHPSGKLFAGTVTGVYRTSSGETVWEQTTLANKDVRTLRIDSSGKLYAGTWGFGVYVSTDQGSTWASSNNGLGTHNIITSLTVTPNQNIFVGTFDGGVAKSVDQGANWTPLTVGYNYIWALASNSSGHIFAGTYGDGIYRSTDDGATWVKTTFPGLHAYEVIIDGNDKIYASSYSGGVYTSTDNGNTWVNTGMGGVGLSTIMVVPNNRALFAGTAAGQIYRNATDITGINDQAELPVKFALEQNYPNPFNPSTIISFSLPKPSVVRLTIYNTVGEEIRQLVNGNLEAGSYNIIFEAGELPSGIYLYRMQVDNISFTKKMILQK